MKAGELWTLGVLLRSPDVQGADLPLKTAIWIDRVLGVIGSAFEKVEKRRAGIASEIGTMVGEVVTFSTVEQQDSFNRAFAELMEEDIGDFEIPKIATSALGDLRIKPGMFWALKAHLVE